MSNPTTVLQYTQCNGIETRIRIHDRPDSERWDVLREIRPPGQHDWIRISGVESRSEPEVLPDA